jgi:hypothetical protein
MKQVRETAVGKRFRFMRNGEGESPIEFRMFRRFVVMNMKIMANLGLCIRTVNLFQDVRISRESGIRNSRESGSRKSWGSGVMNRRSSESRTCEIVCSDPRNSGVMNKSSEIRKKPSQRRYLNKSGFNMWTSDGLVNVWNQPRKSRDVKDIYAHAHTRNIPKIWEYFWDVKSPFVSL